MNFQISDPGFDWSDSGFRPEDFVEVGKVGELEDDEELIKKTGLKMEKPEQLLQKDETKGKSRIFSYFSLKKIVCIFLRKYEISRQTRVGSDESGENSAEGNGDWQNRAENRRRLLQTRSKRAQLR